MKRYLLTMLCLGCLWAAQTIGASDSINLSKTRFLIAFELNRESLAAKDTQIAWDSLKASGSMDELRKSVGKWEANANLCDLVQQHVQFDSVADHCIDGMTYSAFIDSCLAQDAFSGFFSKRAAQKQQLADLIVTDMNENLVVPRILTLTPSQPTGNMPTQIQINTSMIIILVLALLLAVAITVAVLQILQVRKADRRIRELETSNSEQKDELRKLTLELRKLADAGRYAPSAPAAPTKPVSPAPTPAPAPAPVSSPAPAPVRTAQPAPAPTPVSNPQPAPARKSAAKEVFLGLPKGGAFATASETYVSNKSLYRLVTPDGRYGEFEFNNTPEAIRIAIQSQTMILEPACIIEDERPTFTSITTIKKGKAIFDNGQWKIVEKSLIRFA